MSTQIIRFNHSHVNLFGKKVNRRLLYELPPKLMEWRVLHKMDDKAITTRHRL